MAESDFERLKALLLGAEREALAEHPRRMDEAERRHGAEDDRFVLHQRWHDDADVRHADSQASLSAHEQRLDEIDLRHESLPQALPGLLERAQDEAGEGRLAKSLSKPIAMSLGTIVREQRQSVVDALFPVFCPAIRKSIAE
jgi:hypothetical protein